MVITVRYFAGARAATGIEAETLSMADGMALHDLAEQLGRRHGSDLARVLTAASFLINEVAGPGDRPIPAGATVDVLPPFAGG